jgi:hypothetical protein
MDVPAMSKETIEKREDGWYCYDDTRGEHGPYQTKAGASQEQVRYERQYLEGLMWCPELGDYVWWTASDGPRRGLTTSAQVIREAHTMSADWIIRTLTGPQIDRWVMTSELRPMTEMEVIAEAAEGTIFT